MKILHTGDTTSLRVRIVAAIPKSATATKNATNNKQKITCKVSCVTYHISCVACHLSTVTFH